MDKAIGKITEELMEKLQSREIEDFSVVNTAPGDYEVTVNTKKEDIRTWPDPLRTRTAEAWLDRSYHEAVHGRGGKRPGAGRPSIKDKKLTIAFRISPETKALYDRAREAGFDVQREIEGFVREYCLEVLKEGDQ